jgi:hypothetical protein
VIMTAVARKDDVDTSGSTQPRVSLSRSVSVDL